MTDASRLEAVAKARIIIKSLGWRKPSSVGIEDAADKEFKCAVIEFIDAPDLPLDVVFKQIPIVLTIESDSDAAWREKQDATCADNAQVQSRAPVPAGFVQMSVAGRDVIVSFIDEGMARLFWHAGWAIRPPDSPTPPPSEREGNVERVKDAARALERAIDYGMTYRPLKEKMDALSIAIAALAAKLESTK